MPRSSQSLPRPRFCPPERTRHFDPLLVPKLNRAAAAAAVLSEDPRIRRLEQDFVAAYYALNREYAALLRVRGEGTDSTRTAVRERAQLRRIERALRRRDALEDYCAPLGIIAEPSMRKGYTVELTLHWGPHALDSRRGPDQVQLFSAFIPLDAASGCGTSSLLAGLGRALGHS